MKVAEIGLNQMGSKRRFVNYCTFLNKSNVDAITFQFLSEKFYRDEKYSQFFIEKDFYINYFKKNKSCKKIGIIVEDISYFDIFRKINLSFVKILSKDFTNEKLILHILENSECKLYLSTGMNNGLQIEKVMDRIKDYKSRIVLIQTQLSCEIKHTNLLSIKDLKKTFGVEVAFGLHSKLKEVGYLSLVYKPESIFFYVKGNSEIKYLDDSHAIKLKDINDFVYKLNILPLAIGCGKKIEMENWR